MSEVTLFIEDTAIRVLVTKGQRAEKWAKMSLEPGLVSDGIIQDETQVASKLKELFKQQKIGTSTVVAGLSGFNSIYRLVSLPELPENLLGEAVKQEASRVIPVPIEEVHLSYQIIPSTEGETHIFLSAFPKTVLDALLKTLSKAGLRANIMDLAPLALCRTVDAPQFVILDARSSSLDIAVMVDRVPQVIRSLSLPGEAQSLTERLPSIIEELNRTITFYNSSHQSNPLSKEAPVFVCGDLALAPDTWPTIAGDHGFPVSVPTSPIQPLEGFDASQFMVNIGLALKNQSLNKEGAYFSLVDFNALPGISKPKEKTSMAKVALPIVVVIGVGAIFYMIRLSQGAEANMAALRAQLPPIQNSIAEQRDSISALEDSIALMGPQVEPMKAEALIFQNTLADLKEVRTEVDGDLSIIAALATDKVNLTNINHNVNPVTVDGIAPDESDILQYATGLRSSGRFSKVVISSIDAVDKEEADGEEIRLFTVFNFRILLIK
jgi:type IV pilus assembly protein PilM